MENEKTHTGLMSAGMLGAFELASRLYEADEKLSIVLSRLLLIGDISPSRAATLYMMDNIIHRVHGIAEEVRVIRSALAPLIPRSSDPSAS